MKPSLRHYGLLLGLLFPKLKPFKIPRQTMSRLSYMSTISACINISITQWALRNHIRFTLSTLRTCRNYPCLHFFFSFFSSFLSSTFLPVFGSIYVIKKLLKDGQGRLPAQVQLKLNTNRQHDKRACHTSSRSYISV